MSNFNDNKRSEESQEIYRYNGVEVVIITVFHDGEKPVAIVEDEEGEQFEVFKEQLY